MFDTIEKIEEAKHQILSRLYNNQGGKDPSTGSSQEGFYAQSAYYNKLVEDNRFDLHRQCQILHGVRNSDENCTLNGSIRNDIEKDA